MEKLRLKTKVLYGLAGVGDSALYNIMGTFALFFLTTVAGVSPAVAGTITAIGSVWDTFCGAVMGYVSDNAKTKFGKRKPFLLAASVPLMIFTSMFFLDLDVGQNTMALYYGVILMLFWTAFSMFFVPYLAWGSELTGNYDERTVLRGYVSFFNTVGTAIGLVFPNILVQLIIDAGYSLETGWQMTGMLCGLVSGATILISAVGIKDRFKTIEAPAAEKKQKGQSKKSVKSILSVLVNMVRNYVQLLKLRTVRYILGASVCYLIGYTIFCSDRMYFFTYNMGLSRGTITLIMMLMTFMNVIFIPLISFVNRWIDKRTTYMTGMTISALGLLFFGVAGIDSVAQACILSVIYSVGGSVYWQLIPAMIYDVCEVDQLINNKERSGMVISLQSLSEALSGAVAMQLMGIILSFSGFDGELSVQSESALLGTGISFTFIPAAFMLLSVLCIFIYPVTKKMYNEIVEALEKRKNGAEIDMSRFRKLK